MGTVEISSYSIFKNRRLSQEYRAGGLDRGEKKAGGG